MKQKFLAYMVVMTMISTPLLAQTTPASGTGKIVYTSVDFILQNIPEGKVVQNQLEVTKAQLDKALQETYKEAQDKFEAYQKNGANMTEVIRADKEKELQNLQSRIQEMQANAQQSLATKQQQLMEPLITKINDAIQAVGKENGFLYILNMDGGQGNPTILFTSSEDNNATNLILRKLGVDPDKLKETKPATAAPAAAPATTPAKPATTPAATPKKK
jgi:outer membrane protein